MTILKQENIPSLFAKWRNNYSGLLIHGDNETDVTYLMRQAISTLESSFGSTDLVDELDAAECKKTPGIFRDQLNSVSLFGERRIIMLSDVDDASLNFLEPVFEMAIGGNFVLLGASQLKRDSKLRNRIEQSESIAAVAIYPADQKQLAGQVASYLRQYNLAIEQPVMSMFLDLAGSEQQIVMQESAKLAIYCTGASDVLLKDVQDICGHIAEHEIDEAVDSVLAGSNNILDLLLWSGQTERASALLISFNGHLARLTSFAGLVEGGKSIEEVVKSARPPIFFKRMNVVIAQLKRHGLSKLMEFQELVDGAILACRRNPPLTSAITQRTCFTIAQNTRRMS